MSFFFCLSKGIIGLKNKKESRNAQLRPARNLSFIRPIRKKKSPVIASMRTILTEHVYNELKPTVLLFPT